MPRAPHINALPPELLQHILLLGKPPIATRGYEHHCQYEVFATAVCRHWRAVALDTPRLWTAIYINRMCWMENLVLLREWLGRSRGAPLDVTIEIKDDELWNEGIGCMDSALLERALAGFAFVVSHAWHWATFECDFGTAAVMCKHSFFKALLSAGEAPMLETLGLYYDDTVSNETHVRTAPLPPEEAAVYLQPVFRGVCPRLKHAMLWGMADYRRHPHLFRSLHRLELGLHSVDYPDPLLHLPGMVACSPHLENLDVTYFGQGRQPWSPRATEIRRGVTSLCRLRSLAYNGFNPHDICDLFDLISAPAVEQLSLVFDPVDLSAFTPTTSDAALRKLVQFHPTLRTPYFPALKSLHLEGLHCTRDALYAVLRGFSATLERLELELSLAASSFLDLLADTQGGTSRELIVPRMRTLKLLATEDEMLPVTIIVTVLMIRASAGCMLETLIVHRDTVPSGAAQDLIQCARSLVVLEGEKE